MAQRTLIGGTAYTVVGGRTLINGTGYNIKQGRTLIGGTSYNIKFAPEYYATIYNTGDMVFQKGRIKTETGKTVIAQYTGFVNQELDAPTAPWYDNRNDIKNIYFQDPLTTTTLSGWFTWLSVVNFNTTNLNLGAIQNMHTAFKMAGNYKGPILNTPNVINMCRAYWNCFNLVGQPICGTKTTNMMAAYANCYNLTGTPVCSSTVTDFNYAYQDCRNITGSPVTTDNMLGMRYAYQNCRKLTGRPVIGNNVVLADFCFTNCVNLNQGPIVGANVTNLCYTFSLCENLRGNMYIYANNITNVFWALRRVNASWPRLNIYFHANTITNDSIMGAKSQNAKTSITGQVMGFTNYSNGCSKTWQNYYFYPVTNVAAVRAANGD